MQLYHRRYHQHRWRASSGGAEHLRGAFEAFAGRLAARAGGHSSFHAQGKGRPVGLTPGNSNKNEQPGRNVWVWQSHQRASNARSMVAARISSAFAKIGFTPDSGSTTTVTRRIGVARARRFFLLAETMDADAALAAGLVDYVVNEDAVVAEAEKIARELASGPTEAYGGIKRLFLQTPDRPIESQLEDEAQTLAAISRTADAQEGVRAFKEKRKPKFAGK